MAYIPIEFLNMDYELDFSIFMAYIPTINGLVGKSSPETIGIFPLNILKNGALSGFNFPKRKQSIPIWLVVWNIFIFPYIYIYNIYNIYVYIYICIYIGKNTPN